MARGQTVNVIAGAIMVGSAGMCLAGALHARKILVITAATIMLVSMIDLASINAFPAVFWAGLLIAAAILLGLELRVDDAGQQHSVGTATPKRIGALTEPALHRTVMIASALAYPAAAWLALTHDRSERVASSGMSAASAGHSHAGVGSMSVMPMVAIALLILALTTLSVVALHRRRVALVVESSGMAAMLTVMLL